MPAWEIGRTGSGQAARRELIERFSWSLDENRPLFTEFFIPGQKEYSDRRLDWTLKSFLAD